MNAKELREILLVMKEFELTNLKLADLEVSAPHFNSKPIAPTPRKQRILAPEELYHKALQSNGVTPEELAVLGLAGVVPPIDKASS